jgi:hypothetical protein
MKGKFRGKLPPAPAHFAFSSARAIVNLIESSQSSQAFDEQSLERFNVREDIKVRGIQFSLLKLFLRCFMD